MVFAVTMHPLQCMTIMFTDNWEAEISLEMHCLPKPGNHGDHYAMVVMNGTIVLSWPCAQKVSYVYIFTFITWLYRICL